MADFPKPALYARETATMRALAGLPDDEPIAFNDIGWDSRVYLARDGEIVFKFARTEEAAAQYSLEAAVLKHLAAVELPCRIPVVRWSDPAGRYLGYEGIPGVVLGTRIHALSQSDRKAIGATMGNFLRILHAQELPDVPVRSLADEIAFYLQAYERSLDFLRARYTERELVRIDTFVRDELLPGIAGTPQESVVCHSDLGPWNIILSDDGTLGVIDFGDLARRSPAKDFWINDDAYAAGIFNAYGADETLRLQARRYCQALPILDLEYFLGRGELDTAGSRADTLLANVRDNQPLD